MQISGWNPNKWEIRFGNWEPQNPFLKFICGIIAIILAMSLTFVILVGVVGPIMAFVLILCLAIILLIVLPAVGIAILAILIPVMICASPLIIIILLIMLFI